MSASRGRSQAANQMMGGTGNRAPQTVRGNAPLGDARATTRNVNKKSYMTYGSYNSADAQNVPGSGHIAKSRHTVKG